MRTLRLFARFTTGSLELVSHGNASYWLWLAFLGALLVSGVAAYARQWQPGLVVTAMRDQVSWGFYIGNFTFLVGVAAAAVVLVIPAYVYDWKPIREIVVYGELLALSAIVMCLLFVFVDIGRPDRFWHLLPPFGHLNFPTSLLAWDVLVLNLYFAAEPRRRHAHPLPRVHRAAVRQAPRGAARAPLDPDGGRHPHRHGLPLQRPVRAAVLERLDPGPAVPGLGVLLRTRDPADRAAAAAPLHALRDPGRGDLEDRRADGLRDVPEPVPARRRGVQGVLLGHRAPALHALLVPGAGRAPRPSSPTPGAPWP